jgi:hypothetical protein
MADGSELFAGHRWRLEKRAMAVRSQLAELNRKRFVNGLLIFIDAYVQLPTANIQLPSFRLNHSSKSLVKRLY